MKVRIVKGILNRVYGCLSIETGRWAGNEFSAVQDTKFSFPEMLYSESSVKKNS